MSDTRVDLIIEVAPELEMADPKEWQVFLSGPPLQKDCFIDLAMAHLRYKRWCNSYSKAINIDSEESDTAELDDLYDCLGGGPSSREEEPVRLTATRSDALLAIRKSIRHGLLECREAVSIELDTVHLPEVCTDLSVMDVTQIELYLGLEFLTDQDVEVVTAIWKSGSWNQFLLDTSDRQQLQKEIQRLEALLCVSVKESRSWISHSDAFLLRYGSHYTRDVWRTCLQIAYNVENVYEGMTSIFNAKVIGAMDPPSPVRRRLGPAPFAKPQSINGQRDGQHFAIREALSDRYNWPVLFLNLFKQYARGGQRKQAYELPLSIFFDAVLVVLGADFAREFTADLLSLLLINTAALGILSTPTVLKTLKAFLLRTHFPSVYKERAMKQHHRYPLNLELAPGKLIF